MFLAMGILIGLFIATGIGVLCLADAAMPGRSISNGHQLRLGMQILGAILLVAGICLVTTVAASQLVRMMLARLQVDDVVVEVAAALAAGLTLSLYPISGALLLGTGGLVSRDRTVAETRKLLRFLDGLIVTGWSLIVAGILFTFFCMPFFGLFSFFVVLILLGAIFGVRRTSQRNGLLWVLAIASGRGRPLAPAVHEYGCHCRGRYRAWVLQLANHLASGEQLPDALDAQPRLLAPDARLAARVGWQTGELGRTLRDMAASQSLRQPVWTGMFGRLLYLALPVILLQFVLAFMIIFIAPKFRRIFADFGVEMPASTQFVCSVVNQYVFGASLPFLLLLEIAIGFYLVFHYMGWAKWNVPLLDRIFRNADRALVLRTLAVYVSKDQPIVAGLRSLGSFYPKLWVRLRLAFAVETIMQGDNWCDSLRDFGLIRASDAALFESAQRVGNLPWALREIADRDERRLGYRLRVASEWLCPIILLSIAGMVFLFVSAFFSPLIKLITELSG